MALSRREQRALREIEELLTADDPALAGLLSRAGAARWETIRRVTRAVVAVAVPLGINAVACATVSLHATRPDGKLFT